MTSLVSHERRITALEARTTQIETSHGETLYKLHRRVPARRGRRGAQG